MREVFQEYGEMIIAGLGALGIMKLLGTILLTGPLPQFVEEWLGQI